MTHTPPANSGQFEATRLAVTHTLEATRPGWAAVNDLELPFEDALRLFFALAGGNHDAV